MGPQFEDRKSFTVTAVNGVYAAEEITFAARDVLTTTQAVTAVTALLETLGTATGAIVELWLLKVGGVVATAGDWLYAGESIAALGAETWPLASWRGVKIRVKSAGVAGTVVVSATAD